MDKIVISVIIPVYNDSKRLKNCLEALEEQTISENFEILVVDNGSEEDIYKIVQKFERAKYYNEKKVGSYTARNCGIEHSSGDILAFTDADCIPEQGWLKTGIDFLRNNPNCDAVGGEISLFPKTNSPNAFELYDITFGFRQENSIYKHGYSVTANLFVRGTAFKEIGLFNEELKSGGDAEWCQRLISKGGNLCYLSSARIKHPALHSFQSFKRKYRRIAGGRFQKDIFDFYTLCRASYHHLLSLINLRGDSFQNEYTDSFYRKISLFGIHVVKISVYIVTYFKLYIGIGKPGRE
ncbi:glycosyltransferase family 2 protein [Aliifodinibius salicampi]|uniref:Glycosyltransferase family 2 protein n=1 Tax=Fodinibius salicampi TaxID=1920655 RepID=A0ABT3PV36_9BACT|nr:glycosyltransferase family 2 protein [Fodinibius salicampi]MCW9711715.1 glycosyltransferase family 2 protein [Fodinibius salicampi]